MSQIESKESSQPATNQPEIFPGFARIWACASLIHQLAFTFWAESWQGWVLVICAIAVLFQPACLYRFSFLIVASLLNLFNKLPFVPNHILFEGMLHAMMVLALASFLFKTEGRQFLKEAVKDDWKFRLLIAAITIKAIYHLVPAIPQNHLFGGLSTALLVFGIGRYLFGRKPVASGEPFIINFAPVARMAILVMYLLAAMQKMNRDYFNPDISCAAKLHIEIGKYFGEVVPTNEWALYGAIWGSLFFEIAIPILLLIPKTRIFGVLSAIWFHLWLSIHPAAGIFSFTSLILAVLYLFLPVGVWKELMHLFRAQLTKVGGGSIEKGTKRTVIFITCFFFIVLGTQITWYMTNERSYPIFHKANRIGFIGFATWAAWISICYAIATLKNRNRENHFPNRATINLAWLGLALVILNGISPWIGGKTQTAFSMYSNLKSEGAGNHYFLKRVDLLPFQKNLVKVIKTEPNLLDPSSKPRGIGNFANLGHRVLPYFELRRILTKTKEDFEVTYEFGGEVRKLTRKGTEISGDEGLLKPIPVIAQKFLWFRRLNAIKGPMPCTH